MNKWSLVLFTLFTQTAVGLLLGVVSKSWLIGGGGSHIHTVELSVCLGLTMLGLITAGAHLGEPRNAPASLKNITTSWLSREVFIINGFACLVALLWAQNLLDLQIGRTFIETAISALSVLGIWAMSRVYRVKTVPIWDCVATPLEFFGTALMLGGALTGVLDILTAGLRPGWNAASIVALVGMLLGLGCKLMAISPALEAQRRGKAASPYKSSRTGTGALRMAYTVRPCLHIIGLILMAVAELTAIRHPLLLLWTGFLFLSAAEVWGRLVFYKSYCRIGL